MSWKKYWKVQRKKNLYWQKSYNCAAMTWGNIWKKTDIVVLGLKPLCHITLIPSNWRISGLHVMQILFMMSACCANTLTTERGPASATTTQLPKLYLIHCRFIPDNLPDVYPLSRRKAIVSKINLNKRDFTVSISCTIML